MELSKWRLTIQPGSLRVRFSLEESACGPLRETELKLVIRAIENPVRFVPQHPCASVSISVGMRQVTGGWVRRRRCSVIWKCEWELEGSTEPSDPSTWHCSAYLHAQPWGSGPAPRSSLLFVTPCEHCALSSHPPPTNNESKFNTVNLNDADLPHCRDPRWQKWSILEDLSVGRAVVQRKPR